MMAEITQEYMMYETSFVRSAIAPETIVAAVAAKTTWNNHEALREYPALSVGAFAEPSMESDTSNPKIFRSPLEYIMAYPTAQNRTAPKLKSRRFFTIMLQAFLALVKPVSTIANPACMKNTRKAVRHSQTRLAR